MCLYLFVFQTTNRSRTLILLAHKLHNCFTKADISLFTNDQSLPVTASSKNVVEDPQDPSFCENSVNEANKQSNSVTNSKYTIYSYPWFFILLDSPSVAYSLVRSMNFRVLIRPWTFSSSSSSFNSLIIPSIDLTAKRINSYNSHAERPTVRFMPTCISAHQHWTWQIILLLNHGAVAGASWRTGRNAEPGPMSGRHREMDTEMTATRFCIAESLTQ